MTNHECVQLNDLLPEGFDLSYLKLALTTKGR